MDNQITAGIVILGSANAYAGTHVQNWNTLASLIFFTASTMWVMLQIYLKIKEYRKQARKDK